MANRFIVQGALGDGKPGYWRSGEWWADMREAKIYKQRASAEKIAKEYGAIVVELTEPLEVYPVRLAPAMIMLIKLRAKQDGCTPSDIIRAALDNHLSKKG